jgi:O-antigen ligase
MVILLLELLYRQSLWNKYSGRLPSEVRTFIQDPHNIIVSITVRVGLVGLGLFFYIIFVFLRTFWKVVKNGKTNLLKVGGFPSQRRSWPGLLKECLNRL